MLNRFLRTLGGNVLAGAAGALLLLLLGRALSPEQYGRFALLQMSGQVLFALWAGWTEGAVLRFGREEVIRGGSLRGTWRIRLAVLAAATAVPALLFVVWDRVPFLPRIAGGEGVVLAYVLSLFVVSSAQYSLQAADRVPTSALLGGAARLCALGVLLAVFLSGPLGAGRALSGFAVGNLTAGVLGLWLVRGLLARPAAAGAPGARAFLAFSLPLLYGTVLGFLYGWLSILLAARWADPRGLGVYALAHQTSLFLNILSVSVIPILVNHFVGRLVEGTDGADLRAFAGGAAHRLAAAAGLAVSGAVAASALLPLLLPPAYARVPDLIAILLPGLGFIALTTLYTPVIQVYSMTPIAQVVATLGVATNFFVSLVLAPRFGLSGIALGMAVGTAVQGTAYAWVSLRRVGARVLALHVLAVLPPAGVGLAVLGLRAGDLRLALLGAACAAGALGGYLRRAPVSSAEIVRWRSALGLPGVR